MGLSFKQSVNEYLRRFRFYLSASNSFLFIGFYKYFYKPSKGSLKEFLDHYSKSKRNKLKVVQIGANDGITNDPIHKFIKRDHWQGVLLEPQSYVYENFLKKIYRKNPGIHTLNAAIGPKDTEQTIYKLGFCNMRWATGLSSFLKENVEKAFSSGMVAQKCAKYQIEIPDDPEKQIIAEKVAVISPRTLMERYDLDKIDLLQIDVEGFDFEVIKIFDIAHTQPKAIIFEHSHLNKADRQACQELLETNHYAVKAYGANTLAMKKPLNEFESFLNWWKKPAS